MRDPDFRPSDVVLEGALFLIDTMGRAERESAAALVVNACRFFGDQWDFVSPRQIGRAMEKGKFFDRVTNPHYPPPEFYDLVENGYAEFDQSRAMPPYDPPIAFTLKGLRALRRWVAKACPKCGEPSFCLWWSDNPDALPQGVAMAWDWPLNHGVERPISDGWVTRYEGSGDERKPVVPKMFTDRSFERATRRNCREIFRCPLHGEFGLVDGGDPFFHKPDARVEDENGKTVFRL